MVPRAEKGASFVPKLLGNLGIIGDWKASVLYAARQTSEARG